MNISFIGTAACYGAEAAMPMDRSMEEQTVYVKYCNLDGVHVFTSDDVTGLYVANRDLRDAYGLVGEAIGRLLDESSYVPAMDFNSFARFLGAQDHDNDIPHPAVISAMNLSYRPGEATDGR